MPWQAWRSLDVQKAAGQGVAVPRTSVASEHTSMPRSPLPASATGSALRSIPAGSMDSSQVVHSGWLKKSPPEKKLRLCVSAGRSWVLGNGRTVGGARRLLYRLFPASLPGNAATFKVHIEGFGGKVWISRAGCHTYHGRSG